MNEELVVEWDVANTDGPEVDCQFVDIYFSADNGQTFPTLLIAATENDGSAVVRMPNNITTAGKVKVKGHNNVFFNINRNNIRVTEPSQPSFFINADDTSFDVCLPDAVATNIVGTSFLGYAEEVTLEISGLPDGAVHTFSQNPMPPDGISTLDIDMSGVTDGGDFQVQVRGIAAGADTIVQNILISATGTDLDGVVLTSPADDTRGVSTIPEFAWSDSPNASGYILEISSSPNFSVDNIIFSRDMGSQTSEPNATFNLENSTLYYWRLLIENDCIGTQVSDVNIFSSQALNCRLFVGDELPLNIPTPESSVSTGINVGEAGQVSDVNVNLVKGSHSDMSGLRARLISPSGTQATLWQGCLSSSRIDAGFDDAASISDNCPEQNGLKIRPIESFSRFNGEELQGVWSLLIEETNGSGRIDEFELELCSSTALASPVIVFNETLEVGVGKANFVSQDRLLAEDENNGPSELLYTLTRVPERGNLERNGEILTLGRQFTQAHIDNGTLMYRHLGTDPEEDSFEFVIEDGEGGWVNKTVFDIAILEDGPTSVAEVLNADEIFSIFPVPASNVLTIDKIEKDGAEWQGQIIDVNGRLIKNFRLNNNLQLNVGDMSEGTYLIYLENEETKLSKKISVVK